MQERKVSVPLKELGKGTKSVYQKVHMSLPYVLAGSMPLCNVSRLIRTPALLLSARFLVNSLAATLIVQIFGWEAQEKIDHIRGRTVV